MIKGKLYYFRYAAILFRKQHYVSSQHRANMELLCKVELLICYSHCISVACLWPLVLGSLGPWCPVPLALGARFRF